MGCPYLHRVEIRLAGVDQYYCRGYTSGKLRVPSLFEHNSYCFSANYINCPVLVHRRRRQLPGTARDQLPARDGEQAGRSAQRVLSPSADTGCRSGGPLSAPSAD